MLNPHKGLARSRVRRRSRRGIATGEEVDRRRGLARRDARGARPCGRDRRARREGATPRSRVRDDTLIAAYLVDPGRAGYELDDLAREYGLELVPEPATEEETASLVRHAEAARRLAPTLRARAARVGRSSGSTTRWSCRSPPCSRDMEDAGIRIDTYRMGEITARLAERVEELEASALDARRARSSSSARPSSSRGSCSRSSSSRQGGRGRPATRPTRGCSARSATTTRSSPVVEEWRELTKLLNTYLLPLPALIDERDGRLHTTINQAVAATGRLSTTSPNLQSIPVRTELGRRIRSAFVADEGSRLLSADYSQVELRDPRPRLRRARPARGVRARRRTSTLRRPRRCSASRRPSSPAASGTPRRWSTSGSSTGSRRSGSPRTSGSRATRRRS